MNAVIIFLHIHNYLVMVFLGWGIFIWYLVTSAIFYTPKLHLWRPSLWNLYKIRKQEKGSCTFKIKLHCCIIVRNVPVARCVGFMYVFLWWFKILLSNFKVYYESYKKYFFLNDTTKISRTPHLYCSFFISYTNDL